MKTSTTLKTIIKEGIENDQRIETETIANLVFDTNSVAKEEFKYDKDAVKRIEEYEKSYRYVMEIDEFQETTEISLNDLRRDIPGFVAPQMYYYLDGKPLLEYIEANLEIAEVNVKHTFDKIVSNQVCVH